MFSTINIQSKILKYRDSRFDETDILNEVYRIFDDNEIERNRIQKEMIENNGFCQNQFNINLLERDNIFHITDIQKICLDYRLRFLPSTLFKGNLPEEAISKINALEKTHHTHLGNFKIVAPAKLMKLENADDPLLFAPMGNNYYYLIHKWGMDLHPFRKILMWPFRSLENIAITIALLSAFVTALLPLHLFTASPGPGEYFFTFLYVFNAIGGLAILWGVSKGKNFNGIIWKSKYYNG